MAEATRTLPVRDLLLGRLLAVDEAARRIEEQSADEADVRRCAWVIDDVMFRIDANGRRSLYGIPVWLVERAKSVLGLLEDEPKDERWRAVFARLRADGPRWQRLADRSTSLIDDLAGASAPPSEEFMRRYDRYRRGTAAPALAAAERGGVVELRPESAGGAGVELEAVARDELPIDADDELTRAVVSRLRRVDVVVFCRDSNRLDGVVLGLDVDFERGDWRHPVVEREPAAEASTAASPWLWVDDAGEKDPRAAHHGMTDAFYDGICDAHHAALALLHEVGIENEALNALGTMRVRVLGLHPPALVDEKSAGLAVALHVIATAGDLPRPRAVATGIVDAKGTFRGLDERAVLSKARAVAAEGVRGGLIAAGPHEDAPEPEPGLRWLAAKSLRDAAAEIWGDRWAELRRQAAWARLEQEYDVGWGDTPVVPVQLPDSSQADVPTDQERTLLDAFLRNHPKVAILGGPAQSGKTWIGRKVEARLRSEGWQTLCIRPTDGELPPSEKLIEDLAPLIGDKREGRKSLLILDGLVATEDASHLETLLELAAAGISVLGLARYDADAATVWSTDEVQTIFSVAGRASITAFAETALASCPALAPARPALGSVVKAAQNDLWLLLELLVAIAAGMPLLEAGAEVTGRDLRGSFLEQRTKGLPAEAHEQIQLLAAASYVGVATPRDVVGAVPEEALQGLGAWRRDGGWQLRSKFVARALLLEEDRPRERARRGVEEELDAKVTRLLRNRMQLALRDSKRDVVQILEGAANQSDQLVASLVAGAHDQLIGDWALAADALRIARLLRRCGHLLHRSQTDVLARRIAQRLIADLPGGRYDARTTAICVRTLSRYNHALDAAGNGSSPLLDDLRVALSHSLRRILAARALPQERIYLMRQLSRLYPQDLAPAVDENLDAFFAGLRPDRGADYRAAFDGISLVRRIRSAAATDGPEPLSFREEEHADDPNRDELLVYSTHDREGRGTEDERVKAPEETPGVRRLLDSEPARLEHAGVKLGRVALRLVAREEHAPTRVVIGAAAAELRATARHTPFRELSAALATLASFDRGMCAGLLNAAGIGTQLATQMSRAAPGEAASMLRTVANLHSRTARDVLYENDRIRPVPLARLAERAHASGDAKGAGMLLKATASIDDLYASSSDGFAQRLAQRLGQEFAVRAVEVDPRPSVIYHLVGALVESHADYLPAIHEAALAAVVTSIQHTRERSWGPRLALLLAQDEALGEAFLRDLRERLGRDTLRHRMLRATEPQAIEYFNRLAAAMYPDLATAFAAALEHWLDVVADEPRAAAVARALAAGTGTLVRAGWQRPGRYVVRGVEQRGFDFSQRILTARAAGDAAEVLRVLTDLDPDAAADAVSPPARDGRSGGAELEERVRRAMVEPVVALELLTAIEEASPGRGEQFVGRLRRGRGWGRFTANIVQIQDPRTLAEVYTRLARLGFIPSTRDTTTVVRRMHSIMPDLRSPKVVAAVMRMLAAWDPSLDLVDSIAEQIPAAGLARRLGSGARPDLEAAGELIGTLLAVGQHEAASEVGAALAAIPDLPRRVGLQGLGAVLAVAPALPPEAGMSELTREARARAAREMSRALVIDPVRHWLGIGWLAHSLHLLDAPVDAPVAPPASLPRADLVVSAWGTMWLTEREWTRDLTDASLAGEVSDEARPWRAAAALMIASRQRVLGQLPVGALVARALQASPPHVLALFRVAASDAELRASLFDDEKLDDLMRRLTRPHLRTDYTSRLLIAEIDALTAGARVA